MGGLLSTFLCLISFGLLCPNDENDTNCEVGTRSAQLKLTSTASQADLKAFLYCTDNAIVDFDTFSNTPPDTFTPILFLTSTGATSCSTNSADAISCTAASEIDVTVCCQEGDSGLNALVTATPGTGSSVMIASSADTEEIYFVNPFTLDITTTAPAGCSAGNTNYACSLSGNGVGTNQAYVEFA